MTQERLRLSPMLLQSVMTAVMVLAALGVWHVYQEHRREEQEKAAKETRAIVDGILHSSGLRRVSE